MTLNGNYYYIPHVQVEKWKTFLRHPTDLPEMKITMSEIKNIQYEFNKLHTEK